jgi:hypothetical protein
MKDFLKTKKDLNTVLEKYDYFNDGFIKQINITSLDIFTEDRGRDLLGEFEIIIKFAHCNYNEDKPPYNQIIKAYFKDVKSINLCFKDFDAIEWDIQSVSFPKNLDNTFSLKITFPFFDKIQNKMISEGQEIELFKFKEAEFKEEINY